ncbi:MAG: DUF4920 domain-containing protein [Myxococcales bacterium]|nr:DUF4920 domain-containing protein [Myxococcales bacterium]
MNLRIAAIVLFGSTTLLACGGGQKSAEAEKTPAEAAQGQDAAKVDGSAIAKAEAAADEDEPGEGEEGCVYGDHDKKEHAHGEEGCPHSEGDGVKPSGEPGHFGAAFALSETKALKDVLASASDTPSEDAIQVSGEIDSVCQKMGCWMVLKDGDEATARILMKDHSFTVPMDSKGKKAIVEGTLAARTFSEKEVKHLEKDGGGDPAAVSGERKEFVLTASGIKIPPNS